MQAIISYNELTTTPNPPRTLCHTGALCCHGCRRPVLVHSTGNARAAICTTSETHSKRQETGTFLDIHSELPSNNCYQKYFCNFTNRDNNKMNNIHGLAGWQHTSHHPFLKNDLSHPTIFLNLLHPEETSYLTGWNMHVAGVNHPLNQTPLLDPISELFNLRFRQLKFKPLLAPASS